MVPIENQGLLSLMAGENVSTSMIVTRDHPLQSMNGTKNGPAPTTQGASWKLKDTSKEMPLSTGNDRRLKKGKSERLLWKSEWLKGKSE
jgi:hypothetical protein